MSIISHMQYIAEYCNILQCSTVDKANTHQQTIETKKSLLKRQDFTCIVHVLDDGTCTPFTIVKYSNAIFAIIALSFVVIIAMHIFSIAQP